MTKEHVYMQFYDNHACVIYLSGAVDESNDEAGSNNATLNSIPVNKGMVLPFVPLSISFEDIRYSVDMPEVFTF